MEKIRVIHLVKEYKGDYPLRNQMVLGLDPARFEAKACYIYGKPDGRNLLDRYGKAIYLESKGRSKLNAVLPIRKMLKKERPDILHCHRHKATLYGTLAALFLNRIKIISHVHGTDRARTLARKFSVMLLTRKISNFICVSNGVQEDLLQKYWGISADKATSIPNGIDYKPFEIEVSKNHARETISAQLEGKFLIGTVGRLAPKKNQKRLIEAFGMALKENPGMCLVIAGTGPLINSLTQTVTNLNLKKNVIFTGFRSDIPVLLRALDAFILPSLPGEGLPLALLEAMGSGLPVIASKIPGVIEIFGGTNMGYLVDPLNTKQMAEEILHISRLSGSELSEMGFNAKKRVFSDYNSGLMVKKISALYETVAP